MTMHEELVERLHKRIALTTAGSPLQDDLQEAADAIEQLIEERDAYRKAMTHEHNRAAMLAWEKEHCWIPETERLPEEYVDVLCYCSRNGEYGCGAWHKEDKTMCWTGLDGMIPTHWMPLPPAPKEVNADGQ